MEHHANDLPWRERIGIDRIFYVDVDDKGRLLKDDIEELFKNNKNVKYITVTAAANVTGYVNDVHEIARTAHKYGAKIIVDGAQIVAHREFRIRTDLLSGGDSSRNIDFFVFSAHKMYSPFGGGAIVGLTDILDKHLPCFYGGGMVSAVYDYNVNYSSPPDLYEAGSPNYPGVVGMLKAMEILKKVGFDNIRDHEQKLMEKTITELKKIPDILLYGDNKKYDDRVGIVVFNIDRTRHTDEFVARRLADDNAIAVRHAKFCAHPYARRLLENPEKTNPDSGESHKIYANTSCSHGGMVRISFGIYTNDDDIKAFIDAVKAIIGLDSTTLEKAVMATTKRRFRVPNDRG